MGDEAVRRELQKTDDAIKAAIGIRPTLMRPPYGSITARQKIGSTTTLVTASSFGM